MSVTFGYPLVCRIFWKLNFPKFGTGTIKWIHSIWSSNFNFSSITNYSSFGRALKIQLFNSVQHFKSISVKSFSKIYEWILRLLITVTCLYKCGMIYDETAPPILQRRFYCKHHRRCRKSLRFVLAATL